MDNKPTFEYCPTCAGSDRNHRGFVMRSIDAVCRDKWHTGAPSEPPTDNLGYADAHCWHCGRSDNLHGPDGRASDGSHIFESFAQLRQPPAPDVSEPTLEGIRQEWRETAARLEAGKGVFHNAERSDTLDDCDADLAPIATKLWALIDKWPHKYEKPDKRLIQDDWVCWIGNNPPSYFRHSTNCQHCALAAILGERPKE